MHSAKVKKKLVSPSRKFSSTPVDCGKGFLSKEQCVSTGTSHLIPADFLMFPRLKSASKRLRFCDATDIIMNATKELKRS
jgi:hypothetical protein